ncbi:protein of unknown function [Lachnospiraceae bacterium C7]|nr:protein of unknown function [Lachnospiraceae bacterium C7]
MIQQERSFIKYLLLSLITCGIYSLFFYYDLIRDINTACAGDNEHTPGLLEFILLSIVTCGIYGIYWRYKVACRIYKNSIRYGVLTNDSPSAVLVLCILGPFVGNITTLVAEYIIISNFNNLAAAYNQTVMGGGYNNGYNNGFNNGYNNNNFNNGYNNGNFNNGYDNNGYNNGNFNNGYDNNNFNNSYDNNSTNNNNQFNDDDFNK